MKVNGKQIIQISKFLFYDRYMLLKEKCTSTHFTFLHGKGCVLWVYLGEGINLGTGHNFPK